MAVLHGNDLCAPLQKARCLALIEEMNTGGRIPSFWTEAVGGTAASAVLYLGQVHSLVVSSVLSCLGDSRQLLALYHT
jgi:hypothetical protein